MKISEAWLREWVNPALNTQEMANQLTMLGLEVDAVVNAAPAFTGVIVAKVVATAKHPEADRLTLCTVDDGQSQIQVVCGALNVRENLVVALATCGATLLNGFKIKKSKLRGEVSNGMLCSASELGIEEKSSGILELPEDAPLGCDLREYLQLDDSIFDLDLTPNRADCFSILGVARELSAKNNLDLHAPPKSNVKENILDTVVVNVKEPAACPKYLGRVIRGIAKTAKTPVWMQERLRRAGLRSSYLVVDVLNYVMLEYGQPLHAFDLHAINGAVQVRFATSAEKLLLLNKQEIELQADCLVIADDEKVLALAGIMGGESSSVTMETENIFIESAFFTPELIANKARRFGLSSDASQRYERGVDPELAERALDRATSLIQQFAKGDAGPIAKRINPKFIPVRSRIHFYPAKVKKLVGIDVPLSNMQHILERLGMQVEINDDAWLVTPPSYRFDISLDVDLIEEISRVYGFDKIYANLPTYEIKVGNICKNEMLGNVVIEHFADRGYRQTISYSFVDPEIQNLFYPNFLTKKLINPISTELSTMRVGMWPGLVAAMIHNVHRQHSGLKLVETGVVFKQPGDAYAVSSQDQFSKTQESSRINDFQEEVVVAGLISGEYGELNWAETAGKFDFYDMKGDLQALFTKFSIKNYEFVKAQYPALHPGKTANIVVNGKVAGIIGAMHPSLLDALELVNEVILFEISLDLLKNTESIIFRTVSKYPQTRRDLSFLLDANISFSDLRQTSLNVIPAEYLKSFDIFDVYIGKGIPTGQKSIAISITLQDDNATLVDEKINQIMQKLLDTLISEYNVVLRSTEI